MSISFSHARYLSILSFFSAALVFSGCAGTQEMSSAARPEIRLETATLAKGITKGLEGSNPSEGTELFTSDDPQAVMWVRLGELYGEHKLKWEWYDPNGNLYLATGNYKINSDGRYRKSNTSWHRIAIKDEKAATLPGRWTVKVALDDKSVIAKAFEIKRVPDLKDISSGAKVKPDRRKWAVVIGIERYRKASSVQFAEKDARLMRDYLANYLGVPEENTITLINEMATKGEIDVLIKDRLKGLLRKDDTLYLYYAGHGILADETPYLLPHDGDPESPRITAYPVEDLYKDLDQLPAKNIFVFMDTCFSGRVGREEKETIVLAGARPGILKVKDPLLLSKKMVVFSAARSNQISNSYNEKQHGLFTYYLLKGMIGEADRNSDRKIQLNELTQYIEEEVGAASRRLFGLSRQQNPVVMPSPLGDREGVGMAEVYQ